MPWTDSGRDARIAVVILNYRTPRLTIACLETVARDVDLERDVIVVVDNASGDGSVEEIRKLAAARGWAAPLVVVESPENRGFAAGNNLGMAAVRAEAYLLLNSDTLLRPGAIAQLWHALSGQTRIGIVGPRLEWEDETPQISCFRRHTPWSELIRGSATGPVRRLLDPWDVPLPVASEPFEPEWTSFAAVLLRRRLVEEIGGLDEGFFMYFEDADYCRRARSAGWSVWHEPRARVAHLRGGTSPVKALTAARKRRPRYFYASRARYFRNAYGLPGLLAANAAWTLGRGIALVREALGSKRPHAVECEFWDTWRA